MPSYNILHLGIFLFILTLVTKNINYIDEKILSLVGIIFIYLYVYILKISYFDH